MLNNKNNFRLMLGITLTLGLLLGLAVMADDTSAQANNAGFHVTICHRTGSASNPYVMISPDVQGVINGHLDHEQVGNGLGGDIIPVFTFEGVTYSKNLGTDFGNGVTGAAILARGCTVPSMTPTPTPGMTPTPTPPISPTPPPPTPVPEPMTILLFGTGLASIGLAARRKFGRKGKAEDEKDEK